MKKITRIVSAILSTTLLASVVTVAPFSVGAAETNHETSIAYSEETTKAIPESPLEQVDESPVEETTVESTVIEATIPQTVEVTTAIPNIKKPLKAIEPVGASAGESVSANGIENKINTLSQAFANAEITHFTNNGEAAGSEESNCYLPNINDSLSKAGLPTGAEAVSQGASAGYSCYGFASYVFWYLYGSNFRYAPTASTPSYGDLLEFNGAHYAIYLGERNGNYYVYDSNWDYQCTIQMHEIPKSWNTPVTIYHASNYAQVFDSEPPKTGGHVDFQRGTTMQGATPINTFVLKYTASDNIGVSRVYAHVWEFGQTEDQARTYEGALSGQNVTVTIPQSEMPESTYSIECYAEDATGNRASIGVKRTYFPIYKVIEDTGTYQVTADTAPVRHSPYEKINGKSTDSGQYHKGLKVSITGYYINSYGNKWYQLDNSNWIYSGNIKKCFQWSDVWNAINPFVGKNEKFYYFSDQAIMAGETVSSKSGASVGAGVDEDSAVGVQNYIRVTGTSPEYYSVNGGNTTYYTITFDANGGSLSTTSKTVVGGSSMGYSPIPYRLGYQFDGWFTAAENGVQYTSDTVVNGNITLYAHWTRIVLLEGYCGDNLYFILYADGGLEFSGYGDMTSHPWTKNFSKRVYEVSMPQEVTSLCSSAFEGCQYMLPFELPNISTIPASAFAECDSFWEIVIPDSVTSIGNKAFYNCENLTTVTMSKSLVSIYGEAFGDCISLSTIDRIPKTLENAYGNGWNDDIGPFSGCESLKTIAIENGLETIPNVLFSKCNGLETILIPDSVTSIGNKAFYNCENLTTVTMSKSLVSIYGEAFGDCISLSTIDCIPKTLESAYGNGWNDDIGPFSGCKMLKTVTFESGMTSIPGILFSKCTGIETITIPNTVTSIGPKAFYSCENLKIVNMSKSLVSIFGEAFGDCKRLTTIDIVPKTLENAYGNGWNDDIGPFSGCESLKTVTIETGITAIPRVLFSMCTGLETITIPNTVTTIFSKSFYNCEKLKTVNMSRSLVYIYGEAFGKCKSLETIEIPRSLEKVFGSGWSDNIGPFTGCENLKNVTFEKGISKIIPVLFSGCNGLETITIPDSFTSIGEYAFLNCTGLKKINIPDSVTFLGACSFMGCGSLEIAVLPKQIPSLPTDIFNGCSSLKSITIPDTVESIPTRAFCDCSSLVSITFPKKLQSIGFSAFHNCDSLTELVLPESVKELSEDAFSNCSSLATVIFPMSIKTIGYESFAQCENLENLVFPNEIKLTKIQGYAFSECTKLKCVDLPNGISEINSYAFQKCSSLTDIFIPSSVKIIGSYAFLNCELLDNVIIADYSIKEVSNSTFKECLNLKKIVLPKGLTKISDFAFANDTGLTEVEIPESVTSIATNAFSYPDNMTAYGYTESYAKQYCDEKGINFVDNHVLSQGIALDQTPCASEDYIIMDLGETNEVKFDVYPLNSNDVISLTSDNTRVTINGMHITSKSAGDSVITATATSGVEYTFTIHNRSVKNVSVKTLPENLRITQGNELDLSGFELQVNYNDNSNAVTDNYTISGFDKDTIGVQTVTVSYVGTNGSTYKTTFNVEVVDSRGNLTGISIKQYPKKLKYVKYDALDLSGLIVVENYDSGLEFEITDYKVTGYNALKLGKQTIKITKGEYTVTFEVEVTEKPVYAIGDTNLDGIVSISDVTAIQRNLAELARFTDEQLALADTNGDGSVDITDATHLQKYLAEFDGIVLGKS